MEKLLFKKVELWLVFLLAILGLVGLSLYGAILRNELRGWGEYGRLGDAVVAIAEIPATAEQLLGADEGMRAAERAEFESRSGWSVFGDISQQEGFLLLSRFDGGLDRHFVCSKST